MRKLTVLLLSGALLAITGGVSVASADDFGILLCSGTGSDFVVEFANTSFPKPAECSTRGASCSVCVDVLTSGNVKLVAINQGRANLEANLIEMIFAERSIGD